MGFQFSETMAGTVEWTASPGERRPFRFEITASAESTRDHLRSGHAIVQGIVYAPPIAEAAPADGLMTIRPLGQRIIRYELAFVGDDGQPYELTGQKDIRWMNLVETWTHLPAEIRDHAGRLVGRCDTRFDLRREGLRFLRSFRPT